MFDDAIRTLEKLFLISVSVSLLWLLLWSTAVEKFILYHDVQDLHAWLFLRERMVELKHQLNARQGPGEPDGIFQVDSQATISDVDVPSEDNPVRDERDITWVKKPIEVNTSWPLQKKYSLTLEPRIYVGLDGATVRLYQIQSDTTDLPLSKYVAIFFRENNGPRLVKPEDNPAVISTDSMGIIEKQGESVRLRMLHQALPRLNRPSSWDGLHRELVQYGYVEPPTRLSTNHPVLTKLQADSDPRLRTGGVQVLGFQVSLGFFFTSVGLIFAAMAFAMIGPLIAIRSAKSQSISSAWTLVTPTGDKRCWTILECFILIVTIVWAAFPMLVLILQLQSGVDLQGMAEGMGRWGLVLSAIGLMFSSFTNGWAAWELRKLRKG
jgi:hypothetical protein